MPLTLSRPARRERSSARRSASPLALRLALAAPARARMLSDVITRARARNRMCIHTHSFGRSSQCHVQPSQMNSFDSGAFGADTARRKDEEETKIVILLDHMSLLMLA